MVGRVRRCHGGPGTAARIADQRGDIIGSWLVQIVALLAVLGLLGHEVIAVVVNGVYLDDTAREVASEALDEYRATGSLARATDSATAVAASHGAELLSVEVAGSELVVSVEKRASTLVAHRIGALEAVTSATATSRAGRSP